MRIGSSFIKQAVRPTGRCVSDAGGGGGCEQDDGRVCGVQAAFFSQLLNLRKGRELVGRETRQKTSGQNFRPAKGYGSYGGVAHGFGLLFPSPVGVEIARCGITKLKFGSCADGIQVGRGQGRCVSWWRKP